MQYFYNQLCRTYIFCEIDNWILRLNDIKTLPILIINSSTYYLIAKLNDILLEILAKRRIITEYISLAISEV